MEQTSYYYFTKVSLRLFIIGLLFITHGVLSNAKAQGNLLITPKRVVFEGQKRSQEINLANSGSDTARYAVSFIQIRMKADGGFEEITEPDPGQNFADKNLRIFPRQVTLAPKESQIVKIQISKTNNLLSGEYRSHLYFRALPKEKPLGEIPTKKDSKSVAVQLTPVFGISIPIIIRVGESTAKVVLSDLKVDFIQTTPILTLKINRSGNTSVYGDLNVVHVSTEGKMTQISLIKGISVYTPNQSRNIKINLERKSDIDYTKGFLKVAYSSASDSKSDNLASVELALK